MIIKLSAYTIFDFFPQVSDKKSVRLTMITVQVVYNYSYNKYVFANIHNIDNATYVQIILYRII